MTFQWRSGNGLNRQESTPALSIAGVAVDAGPRLAEILEAQRSAERIVGDHASLWVAAEAIVERSRVLDRPLLWPVGEAAERLAGAAVLTSAGGVRARGWTDGVRGERVLLVTVADITGLALSQAARHARELGAAQVHACAVDGDGSDWAGAAFDSYYAVRITRSTSPPPTLVAVHQ